jgi:hypothetical protein
MRGVGIPCEAFFADEEEPAAAKQRIFATLSKDALIKFLA